MAKKSESREFAETEELLPAALMATKTVEFESTSDDRLRNNPVRHQYRLLSDEEKDAVEKVKDLAQAYIDFLHELGDKSGGLNHDLTEARKLAITSAMWAVRSITA